VAAQAYTSARKPGRFDSPFEGRTSLPLTIPHERRWEMKIQEKKIAEMLAWISTA